MIQVLNAVNITNYTFHRSSQMKQFFLNLFIYDQQIVRSQWNRTFANDNSALLFAEHDSMCQVIQTELTQSQWNNRWKWFPDVCLDFITSIGYLSVFLCT